MDCERIVVVHEQNHFVPEKQATESPGFPGRTVRRDTP